MSWGLNGVMHIWFQHSVWYGWSKFSMNVNYYIWLILTFHMHLIYILISSSSYYYYLIFIYLFILARLGLVMACRIFVAVCLVEACRIFSCGIQTLSCGMRVGSSSPVVVIIIWYYYLILWPIRPLASPANNSFLKKKPPYWGMIDI